MSSISPEFILEINNKIDIVDLINRFHPLKKVGSKFRATCPFHTEKTASFYVTPDRQMYKCFGCGQGGDSIKFVREYFHLDFVGAVEKIANIYGLEVPKSDNNYQNKISNDKFEKYYNILKLAKEYFYNNLINQIEHNPNSYFVDYLKKRGLTKKVIKNFSLGFAYDSWDNLIKFFSKENINIEDLVSVGLVTKNNNNKKYDKFRDRIIFPINDHRGRVVGFGGRVISKGEPKYLNSPETIIFSKRKTLYGLYEVLKENRSLNNLLIVEGYMDVIGLAKADINNAVATLGTAITVDHIKLAFKYTNELIYCYDGDQAGKKAAYKALELTLPLLQDGKKAKFLLLPAGEDPDSLVAKGGKTAFMLQQESAFSLADFLFNSLQQGLDLQKIEDKASFGAKAKNLIMTMPQSMLRQMMLTRLNSVLGFEKKVNNYKNRYQNNKYNKPELNNNKYSANRNPLSPISKLILILLSRPVLVFEILLDDFYKEQDLEKFIKNSEVNLLIAVIRQLKEILDENNCEEEKEKHEEVVKLKLKGSLLTSLNKELHQKFIQLELHRYINNLQDSSVIDELNIAIIFSKQQIMSLEIENLLKKSKVEQLSDEEKARLKKILVDKDSIIAE